MKILWMSWKDRQHPQAGGAEVVNEELAKRLVVDGHEVIFLVGGFSGGKPEEASNGYKIIRLGNRWTLYWQAYKYYKKHLVGWADLVIDEVNTIPFLAKFYVKEPNLLFVHMLCRQIWFYELFFPLSLVGYLIEPLYLWLLRDRQVMTISASTKQDLKLAGFKESNISTISVGIELAPISLLSSSTGRPEDDPDRGSTIPKYPNPTLLSLGAIRPMKRTHHQIKAFEQAKLKIRNLKLKIAGDASSRYGQKVLKLAKASRYADDIECLGKVTPAQKAELMQKCQLILVTSIKEGWGLIVTEAASQGTPAVVYDVDGLRDSVRDGQTGLICHRNNPQNLAQNVVELLRDKETYQQIQRQAYAWSKEINFDRSYQEFKPAIK